MLSGEELTKVMNLFHGLPKAWPVIRFLERLPDSQKNMFLSALLNQDSVSKDMILKYLEEIAKGTYTEQISSRTSPSWEKSNPHYPFPQKDLYPTFPVHPVNPSCDRCSNTLHGKYYKWENKDLCRRCMRRIRIRRKILAAMPNREIWRLVRSAVKDLRNAAKYDRQNEQIKTNLKNIKPLLSSVGGSGMMFFCFWTPLWVVVQGWDHLTDAICLILYGVDFRPRVDKILHSKTGGKVKKKKPKPFFRI